MEELTDKEKAICRIIRKRRKILMDEVVPRAKNDMAKEYYEGKMDGYSQALDLIESSLESLMIEL